MTKLRRKLSNAWFAVLASILGLFWDHNGPRWPWRRRHWTMMAPTDGHGRLRNKRCPCRSGEKFKRCHGATKQQKRYWRQQREYHLDCVRIANFLGK